jgi:hypothetical protein
VGTHLCFVFFFFYFLVDGGEKKKKKKKGQPAARPAHSQKDSTDNHGHIRVTVSPVATSSLSFLGLLLLVFKTLTSSSHLPHSLPLCPS